ncbi:MAG: ankyrin repeat domain-containing protein [Pseudomonadota bacterium]
MRTALALMIGCMLLTAANCHAASPDTSLLWQLVNGENIRDLRNHCATRCDFNFHDPASGKTPVLRAIENFHLFMLTYLLANGADPNLPDAWGEPAAVYAIQRDDSRPLARLLAGGANPNAVDRNGLPVLLLAIQQKKLMHVRLLLAAGAKANLRDNEGKTALMYAIETRSVDLVQVMLDAGAKTEAVDRNGVSLQQLAAKLDMLTALRKSGPAGVRP